jgi:hypothetical protein
MAGMFVESLSIEQELASADQQAQWPFTTGWTCSVR